MARHVSPEVQQRLASGEQIVASKSKAWLVGTDGVDHPCEVVLTDRQVLIDVRPQTLAPNEVLAIPLGQVAKCGWQWPSPSVPIRFVLVTAEGSGASGIALDIPGGFRGRRFAERMQAAVAVADSGP